MLQCRSAELIHHDDIAYLRDLLLTFELRPCALKSIINDCKDPFEDIQDRFETNHQTLLDLYERTIGLTELEFKSIFVDSLLFQRLRADELVDVPLTKKGLAAHATKYAKRLFNVSYIFIVVSYDINKIHS
jgi:hypothetical protein